MLLRHLSIQNFRNIAAAELECSSRCNLIIGDNAAGKTSILEAIYFLARIKSFRTHRSDQLHREGSESFQITAQLLQDGRTIPVGLRRGKKEIHIRLAGAPVRKVSELAAHLPLISVTSDLHKVLEEGPKYRRQFLDWGLFHVEPRFHSHWTEYALALKQRNACLRSGGKDAQIRAWDVSLLQSGKAIHSMRVAYLQELEPVFTQYAHHILGITPLCFHYTPGWAQRHSYEEALAESLPKDREQGFTRVGPHRADVMFLHEKQDLRERLSRGQQKQLVIAMMLAQAELLKERRGHVCQFLLDDLPAELDQEHQSRVLAQLERIGAQVFITAMTAQTLNLSPWETPKVFHVEHGNVKEVV